MEEVPPGGLSRGGWRDAVFWLPETGGVLLEESGAVEVSGFGCGLGGRDHHDFIVQVSYR